MHAFSTRILDRRHDAQVRVLQVDLKKAARHPVLEPRPFGRHKERLDISALGSHGGADMFDITICHPLSPVRIRDGLENPLMQSLHSSSAVKNETPAHPKYLLSRGGGAGVLSMRSTSFVGLI